MGGKCRGFKVNAVCQEMWAFSWQNKTGKEKGLGSHKTLVNLGGFHAYVQKYLCIKQKKNLSEAQQ